MAVTTANEPWKALQDLIASQATLIAALTGGAAQSEGASFSGFPCLTWVRLGDGANPVMDIEGWQDHSARLQFDLWVSSDQAAEDLKALVDAMNDAHLGGVLDTAHWKIVWLRRESEWRPIRTGYQDETGNQIVQWSSDWRYKFRRFQNVA